MFKVSSGVFLTYRSSLFFPNEMQHGLLDPTFSTGGRPVLIKVRKGTPSQPSQLSLTPCAVLEALQEPTGHRLRTTAHIPTWVLFAAPQDLSAGAGPISGMVLISPSSPVALSP